MQIEPERCLQRSEGHLIHPQSALQGMLLELRNQLALADDNPCLWATGELVAREAHQADACGNHLLRHWLLRQAVLAEIDQRAAAQVGHHRHVQRQANLYQLRLLHRFGEASDGIVTGMHLHQQRRIFAYCVAVIFGMGAVGGAHLVQNAARLAHYVRNTKRAADLHQLAARHHDLFTVRQRGQHQQHRRRVVIDDAGILRAGQAAEQIRHAAIAMAAPGLVKGILQRYRGAHRLGDRVDGGLRL